MTPRRERTVAAGSSPLGAGVAAAWGVRAPAGKGPKPGLTLARIVEAAVGVADAEGLAAVSMSRVAKELHTGAMSLYRYVDSKDELLALMVDAALGEVPPTAGGDWRERLERWARATAQALREHPWAVNAPIAGPPLAPHAVAWFEDALAALENTGLTEAEKPSVVLMISGYVTNHVTVMAQVGQGFLGGSPDAAMRGYADTLRRLADRERFPALNAVLDAGVFDRADPPDQEFAFGLERILDGVGALIRTRSRS